MKIFLPFQTKDIGGTSTFAKKFKTGMEAAGHEVFFEYRPDYDVLFLIVQAPFKYIIEAKQKGRPIVQRLDGVYHPATPAGRFYPLYNLKMQIIHKFFADIVVYQSTFSRLSCERFLGKTRAKHTTIIYNGVDTEKIRKRNKTSNHRLTKLVTFAKFRRHDQIEPLLESMKRLDPTLFSFDIYGSYTENLRLLFKNLPKNIRFVGKQPNIEILRLLPEYDIFLFSDQSACPNSVLEAMAAGLPTVAFNRGSISELVESGYNGEVVSLQQSTESFSKLYPFSTTDFYAFAKSISIAAANIVSYSQNAIALSHKRFSILKMIKEYENQLTKLDSK